MLLTLLLPKYTEIAPSPASLSVLASLDQSSSDESIDYSQRLVPSRRVTIIRLSAPSKHSRSKPLHDPLHRNEQQCALYQSFRRSTSRPTAEMKTVLCAAVARLERAVSRSAVTTASIDGGCAVDYLRAISRGVSLKASIPREDITAQGTMESRTSEMLRTGGTCGVWGNVGESSSTASMKGPCAAQSQRYVVIATDTHSSRWCVGTVPRSCPRASHTRHCLSKWTLNDIHSYGGGRGHCASVCYRQWNVTVGAYG